MIRNIYAHMQKEIRKGANTFSLHCLSPCENFGSITKLFFKFILTTKIILIQYNFLP